MKYRVSAVLIAVSALAACAPRPFEPIRADLAQGASFSSAEEALQAVEGPIIEVAPKQIRVISDICSAKRCVPENLNELLTYREPGKLTSYPLNSSVGRGTVGGLSGKSITSSLVVFSEMGTDRVLGWYWHN